MSIRAWFRMRQGRRVVLMLNSDTGQPLVYNVVAVESDYVALTSGGLGIPLNVPFHAISYFRDELT